MSFILGIDYGRKRIGLALAEKEKKYVFGYKTIEVTSEEEVIKKLAEIVEEKKVNKIILGYPKGLSGKVTERGQKVKEFKEKLEKLLKKEVVLFDERFISDLAKRIVLPNEDSKRQMKKYVKKEIDMLSAIILLQDYFKSGQKEV